VQGRPPRGRAAPARCHRTSLSVALTPEELAQLAPRAAARLWALLLRLMSSTRGVATLAASRAVAKMLTGQSAAQRRRDRLVELHRALKTHVLGGSAGSSMTYNAVKKKYPAKYNGLRRMAEASAKGRFKLRYLVPDLQEPALEECRLEAEERVRLEHVLYWKVDISTPKDLDERTGKRRPKESLVHNMRLKAGNMGVAPGGSGGGGGGGGRAAGAGAGAAVALDSASVAYKGAKKSFMSAFTGKKSEKR